MPTYDYRCDACGHAFELFQSIKAEPIKACPKCGAESARRVIGAGGGFIFKGSGFYITDYTRSKDYQEKAKSESGKGEAKAGEKKSDEKKDTAAPAAGSSGSSAGGGSSASPPSSSSSSSSSSPSPAPAA
jgi:putative FmdB family regulatory protein